MEKEQYEILCICKQIEKKALLELEEGDDYVKIYFSIDEFCMEKKGDNYFETLVEIRRELEKKDIALLCKGCCKNVYPSGMLLSMGTGRRAYTLFEGQAAKMNSLVDIFESCSRDEYSTVEQQKDFFECWVRGGEI